MRSSQDSVQSRNLVTYLVLSTLDLSGVNECSLFFHDGNKFMSKFFYFTYQIRVCR